MNHLLGQPETMLILTVPKDDPLGLLSRSSGGCEPPKAWQTYGPTPEWMLWAVYRPIAGSPAAEAGPHALVLEVNGVPDAFGRFVAWSALAALWKKDNIFGLSPYGVMSPELIGRAVMKAAPAYRLIHVTQGHGVEKP